MMWPFWKIMSYSHASFKLGISQRKGYREQFFGCVTPSRCKAWAQELASTALFHRRSGTRLGTNRKNIVLVWILSQSDQFIFWCYQYLLYCFHNMKYNTNWDKCGTLLHPALWDRHCSCLSFEFGEQEIKTPMLPNHYLIYDSYVWYIYIYACI